MMLVRFLKVYKEFGTAWHMGDVTQMSDKDALRFTEWGVVEKIDGEISPMCAITIHPRLQEMGKRFIRMIKKNPIDSDFPRTANYTANDPIIVNWINAGNNYGVLGGDGLVILDADREELKQLISSRLPETFTVQSPGSLGWHSYYKCNLSRSIRLKDKDKNPIGEVQYTGKCVVGPNSIHPNGGIYQVIKDIPIAEISEELLRSTFAAYIKRKKVCYEKVCPGFSDCGWKNQDLSELDVLVDARPQRTPSDNLELDIRSVISIAGLTPSGDEYFGEHPVHSSDTGHNFWVNVKKNVWKCFRCDSGGGPWEFLAVENGIIRCENAGPGCLRGPDFLKVLEIARKKGLVKDVKIIPKSKRKFVKGIWREDGDGKNGKH